MRWHWKDIPIVGDLLTLPNACIVIVITACANMLQARIEPNESGEAAAEARVTNNEVKLRNNKVTKKAVGRAVQVLGGTVVAIYYDGGWALVRKLVGVPIVSALFVYMTSRADMCESVCESANNRFRVTPRWRAFRRIHFPPKRSPSAHEGRAADHVLGWPRVRLDSCGAWSRQGRARAARESAPISICCIRRAPTDGQAVTG